MVPHHRSPAQWALRINLLINIQTVAMKYMLYITIQRLSLSIIFNRKRTDPTSHLLHIHLLLLHQKPHLSLLYSLLLIQALELVQDVLQFPRPVDQLEFIRG